MMQKKYSKLILSLFLATFLLLMNFHGKVFADDSDSISTEDSADSGSDTDTIHDESSEDE